MMDDLTIEAADTLEETIALRNNAMVNATGDNVPYNGSKHIAIDIDNAKWQKEFSEKMEHNLDRFKELGLYKQLQDFGILYNEDDFQRNYVLSVDGKSSVIKNDENLHAEVERQFDELCDDKDKQS